MSKRQTLTAYLKEISKDTARVKLPELDVIDVGYWARQVLKGYFRLSDLNKQEIKRSAEAYRKWKDKNN
jgi:hypothetical protein